MDRAESSSRWGARPLQAAFVRAFAFLAPIAASIAFVHVASRIVPVPTGSWWVFLIWWIGLSALATGVLIVVDRYARRLLPLVALLKLSLVFPDRAPSRFQVALRAGTMESLEERIDKALAAGHDGETVDAARRLLELVTALDFHDKLTRGHAERVRAYTQLIAAEMRLGKKERDLLNWAALLHDIGKLGVPSSILTKPGRLTEEEYEVVQRHPELGEELVAPLRPWLGEWTDAVSDHHERWDGKGYPRGKAGDQIALAGRMVAVADVFDVITSSRSYKEPSTTAEARMELARNAGSQFDERIVRALLGVSLGRLRLAMGPLSWLAHLPILGRFPLTPAVTSLSGALAVVAAAVTTGLVAEPAPGRAETSQPRPAATSRAPEPAPAPAKNRRKASPQSSQDEPAAKRPQSPESGHPAAVSVAPHVDAGVDEDSEVVVRLDGITGSPDVTSLRISMPAHVGRSSETLDHAIFYRPPPDYNGETRIGYEVCRVTDACALGEVQVTVRPVNDAPELGDDVSRTAEDEPVAIDVLGNDSDVDGERLELVSASGESRGNARVRDGRITWSGPANFNGEATFAYTATDGHGAADIGNVVVRVAPANDAPSATADKAATQEGVPVRIRVLANDSDVDGDPLDVLTVEQPKRGSAAHDGAAVTYSPPAGFSGATTFAYTATDGHGGRATAEVEVSVGATNGAPRALDDVGSVLESGSTTINVLLNDSDPEGGALTLVSVGKASSGTATREGNALRFAAPDTSDAVSVEYVVRDAQGATDRGRVAIDVVGVNDPPSFAAGADQGVQEDAGPQTVAGWAQAIDPGPADESAQTVTFLVTNSNPSLFTAGGQPAVSTDGTLTYTPAPNAHGGATVSVQPRDDGGTAHGGSNAGADQPFSIVVAAVNDLPIAAGDAVSVAEDAAGGVTFDVLANDTDADAGTVLSLTSHDPSGVTEGVLTHNGAGSFTFVPDAGFSGSQSFSYAISDGGGGSDTGLVTVTVSPEPDAPAASDDAYGTLQGVTINEPAPGLIANDSDQDEDPLTVQTTPVTPPSNGNLTLFADGSFSYTPNLLFVGTDTFTYRVGDGTGLTADASVTITVSLSMTTSLLFLGTSGLSAEVWDLTTTPPPPASPVPDFEGDGAPGLSIFAGNGGENESDVAKRQEWTRPVSLVPLVLNGPVTLQLWSSVAGFDPDDGLQANVFLYDCLVGGTSCVKIGQNRLQVPDWNGGVSDWVYHEIPVGSVSRTLLVGRELRVRVQATQNTLWVAMTAAYPSALQITTP